MRPVHGKKGGYQLQKYHAVIDEPVVIMLDNNRGKDEKVIIDKENGADQTRRVQRSAQMVLHAVKRSPAESPQVIKACDGPEGAATFAPSSALFLVRNRETGLYRKSAVSHGPRESKFGGNGVSDRNPRRKQRTRCEARKDKDTNHANYMLHNTYENAACGVETLRLEELPEDVLVRLLQNAYIRVGTCFIKSLPNQCPFRMLPRELARPFNLGQDVKQVWDVVEGQRRVEYALGCIH
ncbi:hypothetical protein BJV74DRAFT_795419 [Russula compacta]|nr:hypothetical protein BJV74DRAFT_795419 [Russula compacta]